MLSLPPLPYERKVYATVLGKFDDFFKVRTNTIYERARFNRRDQQEGESAEQCITAWYGLVETWMSYSLGSAH